MSTLYQRLRNRTSTEQRYSIDDYLKDLHLLYQGHPYSVVSGGTTGDREEVANSFVGYVQQIYKSNGVVFATSLARLLLFTEARFQWQQMRGGRPGDLFGNQDLEVLERPWPNGTTGELLARAEQDVTAAGNFYVSREGKRLRRHRPDWVEIVLTAPPDEAVESDVAGYLYTPGGSKSKAEPRLYLPGEMAHWSPIPDPEAHYRGMSWLTPVIREVQADGAATRHKLKYFENGTTPKLAVSLSEKVSKEQFQAFIAKTNAEHQGEHNAYKTLFLGGGADVKVVGADLKQLDFKVTQGAGETRIAAAAGVPPIIVGLSEGLEASTYSNYGQARRKMGDHWARPQWRSVCAALEPILRRPDNARLWYDDRDIAFLREDEKDAAEILSQKMLTIESGVRSGYTPESVVDAVDSGDLRRLKHTGLFSVQLQPPGSGQPAPAAKEVQGEEPA
ncbi:phage portal protein BeeE [Lentzea atacamensis]|uniref:Phage portal protein BeeE n=1 Tax=Lentzea atacamensis TaxID=531938 RepID=A0A316HNU8_9PSEU|nr:phage portal protein [Lentzea atacamensis]PWK81717.1 phage portal protein BeeE [Lentzea atacamensis]